MTADAAVDLRWGLGKDGGLLYHIREDLKRFRALTTGGAVIMGRKTLDSLPGGKPLPNRRNIVLTRDPGFHRDGVEAVHTVEEALALTAGEDPERVWLAGGGELYRQLLPLCRRCCLTRVYEAAESDVFFPDLDALPQWRLFRSGPILRESPLAYQFVEYVNECVCFP